MKSVFFFLAILSTAFGVSDISQVRLQYKEASTNAEKTKQLYEDLGSITKESDVLLIAYKGAATTLMAKYAKTIKEKKAFFREGVGYIEYAVEQAPNNVEIRYLRLSVKENAPRITGYKRHMDKDKTYILEHLVEVENQESKKYIKGYVSQSDVFDADEKRTVSKQ